MLGLLSTLKMIEFRLDDFLKTKVKMLSISSLLLFIDVFISFLMAVIISFDIIITFQSSLYSNILLPKTCCSGM